MDEPLKSSSHNLNLSSNECLQFYGSSFAYPTLSGGDNGSSENDPNNNNNKREQKINGTVDVVYVANKNHELSDFKRQQEKFNIIKEVLSSEKKYLNDLKEIVEGYYEEIKKCSTDEFVYHIFANIKDIYEFTKSFYSLLESSTEDEVGIANCFIKKHKVFLRLYSTYCQNYRIAYNTTEKLETENNIAKIIQKIRKQYGHCLKMTTYLQLPVLRITKYHLLLQRYLNLLEVNSSAYNQVLEALGLMKQVNDCINQDMPDDEKRPSSLDHSVSTINMNNFVKLFGQILKQGNLFLAQTKKFHYVIVFQKLFVIRKADSPNKIMHSISNESLALLPTSCKAKTRSFTVIDYSQPKDNVMWQFLFKAKSEEEKKSWQSTILSCMLNGYNKKLSERVKSKLSTVTAASASESISASTVAVAASLDSHLSSATATDTNATANTQSIVPHTTRSAHDIIKEKIANFRRLAEFRHSLRTDTLKDSNMTTSSSSSSMSASLGSSLRHQFEEAFKRRLSNPVTNSNSCNNSSSQQQHQQQSSSSSRIVTKLLDKTMTLGAFTKETLASPMMKFRHSNRQHLHQLARIGEASNEASFLSPTATLPTSMVVRSSISTPIIQHQNKTLHELDVAAVPAVVNSSLNASELKLLRSDSFNVLNPVSTSTSPSRDAAAAIAAASVALSPIELARSSKVSKKANVSTLIPIDYLNRSFDHIDDCDSGSSSSSEDENGDDDLERHLKLVQYKKIICEMNRTFIEKYGQKSEKSAALREIDDLKQMEIKEFSIAKTNESISSILVNDNNDEMATNTANSSSNSSSMGNQTISSINTQRQQVAAGVTNNHNGNHHHHERDRSSKSSINSEEGYYSHHESSSSCSTLVESSASSTSAASSSTSPPSSSSSEMLASSSLSAAAAAAAAVHSQTGDDQTIACFPLPPPSPSQQSPTSSPPLTTTIVNPATIKQQVFSCRRPPNPPPPIPPQQQPQQPSMPLFKLEKISIKKIDFGEAIDASKAEAELNDLLLKKQQQQSPPTQQREQEQQTTTLTINLKQTSPQQQPNLRVQGPNQTSRPRLTTFGERERVGGSGGITTSRSGLISTSSSFNLRSSSMRQQHTHQHHQKQHFHLLQQKQQPQPPPPQHSSQQRLGDIGDNGSSLGHTSTTSSSEYDLGRRLLMHSFKVAAKAAVAQTSKNRDMTSSTKTKTTAGSKLSLNDMSPPSTTTTSRTNTPLHSRITTTTSSTNLDTLGFVNVRELINKFESKF